MESLLSLKNGLMKTHKVVVLGSGAHAAELIGYINDNNKNTTRSFIEVLGLFDDDFESWKRYQFDAPLLGGLFDYNNEADVSVIIAIANVKLRKRIIEHYLENKVNFFTFIHYSSFIFKTAKIGVGNIITRNCTLGPNSVLGDFNSLNTNSSIGHDSILGNNNVLCPNTGFSGNTKVGDNNFFSLNSVTIPNVVIGNNNVIAPNMVIEKNIKSDTTVFHRFKEKVIFSQK